MRLSLLARQCMWLRLRSMMPLLTTGKSGGGPSSRTQRTRPMPPLPGTRSLRRRRTRLLPALLLRPPPRSPRSATFLMSSRKFQQINTFCLCSGNKWVCIVCLSIHSDAFFLSIVISSASLALPICLQIIDLCPIYLTT